MTITLHPGRGDPVIRSMPRPSDVNASGDIFGGWVLSQMDIAGGIVASARANGRVATVAINAMRFNEAIHVGDIVSIYGEVVKVGRTSMTVRLETLVHRRNDKREILVTEGVFTFVAIDDKGRPRPVDVA